MTNVNPHGCVWVQKYSGVQVNFADVIFGTDGVYMCVVLLKAQINSSEVCFVFFLKGCH